MKVKKIKSNNYLFNIFIILLLFIIVICIYLCLNKSNKIEKIDKKNKKSIEIVVSRYNEDLKWTLDSPFNKYKYIVYNKGDNENYEKTNVLRSYNIKNEGKCDHTYIYHIVHNYYHLSDIVVFLPGCIDQYFKYKKAKLLLEQIEKNNEAYFIIDYKCETNVLDDFYYFKIDEYKSMTKSNLEKNDSIVFRKSKIRPFCKWYENNFNYDIKNVSYFGIFSCNKKDIYNHDKSFYFKHMKSLQGAANDELSHYYERSWEAMFYPMNNTYFINYTNILSNIYFKYCNLYSKYNYQQGGSNNNSNKSTELGAIINHISWNFIYFINTYTYYGYNI
jgi:hypothetical protein